jgi:hypothetical protein
LEAAPQDGDCHGVAVNDGGRDELRKLKVIDDIAQRTISLGKGRDAGVLNVVLIGCVKQHGAQGVAGCEGTADQAQFGAIGPRLNLWGWIGCKN